MDLEDKAPVEAPEDMYKKYKILQKQLEFLTTQEDYLKDEMKVRQGRARKRFKIQRTRCRFKTKRHSGALSRH